MGRIHAVFLDECRAVARALTQNGDDPDNVPIGGDPLRDGARRVAPAYSQRLRWLLVRFSVELARAYAAAVREHRARCVKSRLAAMAAALAVAANKANFVTKAKKAKTGTRARRETGLEVAADARVNALVGWPSNRGSFNSILGREGNEKVATLFQRSPGARRARNALPHPLST